MTATAERKLRRLVKGRGVTCPVCGNDHSCAFYGDDAVFCLRVADGCATHRDGSPITLANGLGWLHRLKGAKRVTLTKLAPARPAKRLSHNEVALLVKGYRTAVNPRRLDKLAEELGVTSASLKAYGIGWAGDYGCWAFPMYDGSFPPNGKPNLCGVRLRRPDGGKLCVPGSRNGLFLPDDYDVPRGLEHLGWHDDPSPLLLVVPEGPTDCAAARDLGFRAVGRPSNNGGIDALVRLLRWGGIRQDVVVVSDNDGVKWKKDQRGNPTDPFWPGIEGAVATVEELYRQRVASRLRWMFPPEQAKDLRAWRRTPAAGAVPLMQAILAAPDVDRRWLVRATERLEAKRKTEPRPAGTAAA